MMTSDINQIGDATVFNRVKLINTGHILTCWTVSHLMYENNHADSPNDAVEI